MSLRVNLALDAGLTLPADGLIAILLPAPDWETGQLPAERLTVLSSDRVVHDALSARGLTCAARADGPFCAALLCLPRARDAARDAFARAMARTNGPLIVDGQKTDGIEGLLRAVRARTPVSEVLSKAHGKIFWLDAQPGLFDDWQAEPSRIAGDFITAPGVFSADAVDPASALLAAALPERLGARVADLGAGWGYLGRAALNRSDVVTLDLVETDARALDCARLNITDTRARFHWADALAWQADAPLDTVVMNPPFHTGRTADPSLGRAFIAAAARNLAPGGTLWMVANRHLPYEDGLASVFARVEETGGNGRFKIIRASRPTRKRR